MDISRDLIGAVPHSAQQIAHFLGIHVAEGFGRKPEIEVLRVHTVALAQGVGTAIGDKCSVIPVVVPAPVKVRVGQFLCQTPEDIRAIHALTDMDLPLFGS